MASNKVVEDEAFVTLVTNDRYAFGALVVGQSLRDVGTTRQLAILVTTQVSQPMRRQLSLIFDYIQEVDPLDSNDDAHLALLTRPELGITFTKLYSWKLTQYSKCVFLDADTLILKNVDDLFDREELSAAPDVGWPDCFNSGVFVFRPSEETYRGLLQCAVTQGSFDGGDQGLLNTFFSDWATSDINKHLPFIYNMTSAVSYSYLPAFVRFGNDVRIVHFIGRTKPWMYRYNTNTGTLSLPEDVDVAHGIDFVQKWWNVFISKVKPSIEQEQGYLFRDPLSLYITPSIVPSYFSPTSTHSPHHHSTDQSRVQSESPDYHQSTGHHHDHHRHLPEGGVHHDAPLPGSNLHPSEHRNGTTVPSAEANTTQTSVSGTTDDPDPEDVHVCTCNTEPTEESRGVDLANTFGDMSLSSGSGGALGPPSPRADQHAWERGQVDYRGKDSFDTIMGHISDVMTTPTTTDPSKDLEENETSE